MVQRNLCGVCFLSPTCKGITRLTYISYGFNIDMELPWYINDIQCMCVNNSQHISTKVLSYMCVCVTVNSIKKISRRYQVIRHGIDVSFEKYNETYALNYRAPCQMRFKKCLSVSVNSFEAFSFEENLDNHFHCSSKKIPLNGYRYYYAKSIRFCANKGEI